VKKPTLKPLLGILFVALSVTVVLILSSIFLTVRENNPRTFSFKRDFLYFYFMPYHNIPIDQKKEFLQQKKNTCGPAALSYLFDLYGLFVDETTLAKEAKTAGEGTSIKGLVDCAKKYGFKAWGEQQDLQGLLESPKPLIVHINNVHFVTVEKIFGDKIILFDPSMGRVRMDLRMFVSMWTGYVVIVDVEEPVHQRFSKTRLSNP